MVVQPPATRDGRPRPGARWRGRGSALPVLLALAFVTIALALLGMQALLLRSERTLERYWFGASLCVRGADAGEPTILAVRRNLQGRDVHLAERAHGRTLVHELPQTPSGRSALACAITQRERDGRDLRFVLEHPFPWQEHTAASCRVLERGRWSSGAWEPGPGAGAHSVELLLPIWDAGAERRWPDLLWVGRRMTSGEAPARGSVRLSTVRLLEGPGGIEVREIAPAEVAGELAADELLLGFGRSHDGEGKERLTLVRLPQDGGPGCLEAFDDRGHRGSVSFERPVHLDAGSAHVHGFLLDEEHALLAWHHADRLRLRALGPDGVRWEQEMPHDGRATDMCAASIPAAGPTLAIAQLDSNRVRLVTADQVQTLPPPESWTGFETSFGRRVHLVPEGRAGAWLVVSHDQTAASRTGGIHLFRLAWDGRLWTVEERRAIEERDIAGQRSILAVLLRDTL